MPGLQSESLITGSDNHGGSENGNSGWPSGDCCQHARAAFNPGSIDLFVPDFLSFTGTNTKNWGRASHHSDDWNKT